MQMPYAISTYVIFYTDVFTYFMNSCTQLFVYGLIFQLSLFTFFFFLSFLCSWLQMLMANMFFCVTAPLGLGLGMGITEMQTTFTTAAVSGTLQGIACGTFLYVTFFEASFSFSFDLHVLFKTYTSQHFRVYTSMFNTIVYWATRVPSRCFPCHIWVHLWPK